MADGEHQEESKRSDLFTKAKHFCQRCSEFHGEADWMAHCERYTGCEPIRQCKTCGGWHALDRWNDNCRPEPNWLRSELASPSFISDNLESLGGLNGIQSQADGRWHTSKSKLRADYRALGMIELGNDKPPPFKKPKPDRAKIKEAVHRAFSAVDNEGATARNYRERSKVKTAFGTVAK